MVPASTKIRPRSLPNVDNARLIARIGWLRENGPALAAQADARIDVAHLARQIHQIEDELARRGVSPTGWFVRWTLHNHLGDHHHRTVAQFQLGRDAWRFGWVIRDDSDLTRFSLVRAGAFNHR